MGELAVIQDPGGQLWQTQMALGAANRLGDFAQTPYGQYLVDYVARGSRSAMRNAAHRVTRSVQQKATAAIADWWSKRPEQVEAGVVEAVPTGKRSRMVSQTYVPRYNVRGSLPYLTGLGVRRVTRRRKSTKKKTTKRTTKRGKRFVAYKKPNRQRANRPGWATNRARYRPRAPADSTVIDLHM